MSFTFRYAVRIVDDLQNGYDYYMGQDASQAAEDFLEHIERTIDIIKKYPYTFSTRHLDVRCGVPKKFPFLVHYKIFEEEKEILFIAVANTHQEPLWIQNK